jgi:hypothetical protein
MTTAARVAGIALVTTWVVAVAPARGADTTDAHELRLEVGQSVSLCSTGTLLCPARDARCDDLSVVAPGADERGPLLKGVKPGTTLCSAAGASGAGARRIYRVTVVAKGP